MIIIAFLSYLLFHFIGDFVLQSDKMAKNKSSSNFYLTLHVLVYSLFCGICIYLYNIICLNCTLNPIILFLALFLPHFAIDYFTSRINSRLWKENKVHWFFVSVGADQYYHQIHLALILHWTLKTISL